MTQSNYISAYHDYDRDQILVWERCDGERVLTRHKAEYYFYIPQEGGEYKGYDGKDLVRLDFDSGDELRAAVRQYPERYESDIQPLLKTLMNKYYDRPTPVVNYAFLDIESDVNMSLGFPSPANPYAIINAITIYQSWTKKYITLAVAPIVDGKRWGGTLQDIYARYDELAAEGKLNANQKPEITLCLNEADLMVKMLEEIQDADIVSGWNSEFYDIPYIVRRLELVLPRLLHKLCFPGTKPPRARQVEKFGNQETVYSLHGRTHLDYKDLFQKFTFEGRESYALGNILEQEIGMSKVHYEGTLEQLYKNDFPTFICYNARDVSGLVDLDEKFKFIQLVNQMAHENTCLFENILGTVKYVETGVTNRAHWVHNVKVPDKKVMTDGEKVEGAIVLNPNVGLHEWVGSVDINSLYPSVIRSLNMSPEKFVGQFSSGELDWRGIMINEDDQDHTMCDNNGESYTGSGKEWKQILTQNKWVLSAYGTVFDQSNGMGIMADTLTFWFAERKRLQAEKKKWGKVVDELKDSLGVQLPDEILQQLSA